MKNALILHGTDNTPAGNWFTWLGGELQKQGYMVCVPQLPQSAKPNVHRYNHHLLHETGFDFNSESILIGHSSGAVAILCLLQALPDDVQVDACYLVGAFTEELPSELFLNPLNYELIKQKAKKIVLIHSDNDPYCPLHFAETLRDRLDAELIVKKGQAHFSLGTFGESYRQFPFLLNLIMERKA